MFMRRRVPTDYRKAKRPARKIWTPRRIMISNCTYIIYYQKVISDSKIIIHEVTIILNLSPICLQIDSLFLECSR
jgi:hypothetical protein